MGCTLITALWHLLSKPLHLQISGSPGVVNYIKIQTYMIYVCYHQRNINFKIVAASKIHIHYSINGKHSETSFTTLHLMIPEKVKVFIYCRCRAILHTPEFSTILLL